MNLLDLINQGIDTLTNSASPSIDALGFHIFVALLTTMMVWFATTRTGKSTSFTALRSDSARRQFIPHFHAQ